MCCILLNSCNIFNILCFCDIHLVFVYDLPLCVLLLFVITSRTPSDVLLLVACVYCDVCNIVTQSVTSFICNHVSLLAALQLSSWTFRIDVQWLRDHHHIIISGFGIYGAAVVPDSGVGNTWQCLTTLVRHEFLSNGLTPSRLHIVISFLTHADHVHDHAVKFARWQHPAVGHRVRFAATDTSCFIYGMNHIKQTMMLMTWMVLKFATFVSIYFLAAVAEQCLLVLLLICFFFFLYFTRNIAKYIKLKFSSKLIKVFVMLNFVWTSNMTATTVA